MTIKSIKQTCQACPAQWESYFADGRPFYIRYRWGYLSICVGKKGKGLDSAVDGREILGEQRDKEGWDGTLGEDVIFDKVRDIKNESNFEIFKKDFFYAFRLLKIVRLFWYYFCGGKKIIAKRVEEQMKKLKEQRKKLDKRM